MPTLLAETEFDSFGDGKLTIFAYAGMSALCRLRFKAHYSHSPPPHQHIFLDSVCITFLSHVYVELAMKAARTRNTQYVTRTRQTPRTIKLCFPTYLVTIAIDTNSVTTSQLFDLCVIMEEEICSFGSFLLMVSVAIDCLVERTFISLCCWMLDDV